MKAITWAKMLAGGGVLCVGGPALVYYVTPTEEELFKKYNPELQRKSLANRKEKQENFDQFVSSLKDYSKSDRPVWVEWEQAAVRRREEGVQAELDRRKAAAAEAEARKREMKESLR